MSIATELSKLANNKAAIKAAIEAQNPTVPPTDNLANWPASIQSLANPQQLAAKLNSTAIAPDFVESTYYSEDDIVTHDGERYKCIYEGVHATWNPAYWSVETVDDVLQELLPSSVFIVTADIDLSTFEISNTSTSCLDSITAFSNNRPVLLVLDSGSAYFTSFAKNGTGSWLMFQILIYVNIGQGQHPYLIQAEWFKDATWNVTPIELAQTNELFSGDYEDLSNKPEIPDVTTKLDSVAAAQDFSSSSTYFVGDYVTHLGRLYKCTTAVTTAGNWTGPTNWTEVDMTSPDATLDITNDGFLRVVDTNGTILWAEGYNLSNDGSSTVPNWAVKGYTFAVNSSGEVVLSLPSVTAGKVGDFVLDVTNPTLDTTSLPTAFSTSSTYAAGAIVSYDSKIWRCVVAVETAGAWTGTTNWEEAWPYITLAQVTAMTASVVVPAGEDLQDMLTFAPGTMCELYFTQTAFNVDSRPTWKVVRQDVEDGGAS